ncbi:MAG: radical SAM protein [Candidatus Omnitrophica bacterium]|nr:radical SAM protein [Candidatus Omnitrophota bacterium]
MNILFLVPPADLNKKKKPVDRVYGCNYGYDYKPAIHLLSLATAAQQAGCRARFMDCPAEGYNSRRFIRYLNNHRDINAVVFFSVWLSQKEDMSAADIATGISPGIKIIFSGPYPTWQPGIFLKKSNYIVIRGEPENTLLELIRSFKYQDNRLSEVAGVSFLKENRPVDNRMKELQDLDAIVWPDRRLLKGEYYFNRLDAYPATIMCASRGCSYACTYCAPQALDQAIELEYLRFNLAKPPLRLKSPQAVIREFQEISALGYRSVELCDNQFLWDQKRMVEVCEGIRQLKLKWICNIRADYLKDKSLLKLMKEAGCQLIYIGTEAFSQAILDDVNKGLDLRQNYRAVELVRECGIEPEVSVLLGASGLEDEKSVLESISEAKKMKTRFVHYSVALPLPNTKLYQIAKNKGWMKTGDFIPVDNTRDATLDLPLINAARLKKIVRQCYIRQYLSLRLAMRQVVYCFGRQLTYKIKAWFNFLGSQFRSS